MPASRSWPGVARCVESARTWRQATARAVRVPARGPGYFAHPFEKTTICPHTMARHEAGCKEGARTGGTGKLLYLDILVAYRLVSEYAQHLASSSHIAFKGRPNCLFFV